MRRQRSRLAWEELGLGCVVGLLPDLGFTGNIQVRQCGVRSGRY